MLKSLAKKFESFRSSLQARLEHSVQPATTAPIPQKEPEVWRKRGNQSLSAGNLVEAARCYQQAVDLDPADVAALVNLGFAQSELKSYDESRRALERALSLDAANMDAWYILGGIEEHDMDLPAAEAAYRKVIGLRPDFELAYRDLCQLMLRGGRLAAARDLLAQGIKHRPDNPGFHKQLGIIYWQLGQAEDAMSSYQRVIALEPTQPGAYLDMSMAMIAIGDYSGAVEQCRAVIRLKPDIAIAYDNMGIALLNLGQTQQALAAFSQALKISPDLASAMCNIGSARLSEGRLDDAIGQYRKALSVDPNYDDARMNLLFALNYHPELDAAEIYAAYQDFDRAVGLPLRATWSEFANSRSTDRRLRIGYVSPDIRQHTVMRFLEPVLARHDARAFEVYAYAEVAHDDAATLRAKNMVAHWRSTVGQSDEAVAQLIREDQIDVLIDLAGHTSGNRLRVFGRKPAPVSVSWLGYGYTTGLTAIDYYLTDAIAAPSGCEHLFAEKPWRMKRAAWIYRPDPGMGAEGPLPAAAAGYVTFGTLTRPIRVNPRVVRVWAEILRRVPQSKLVVDSKSYADASTRTALIGQFAALGIAFERLRVGYHSPPWDLLRSIDIALDCFPHNSGTTLFESLFMGVPYVTLAGRPSVGRLGASILQGLGHPKWIARSEDEYVEIAVKLAQDSNHLARVRAGLRRQMQESCLMDETGFTRDLEQVYRDMFQAWAVAAPRPEPA